MGYNLSTLERFWRLFTSNEDAYGSTIVGEIKEGKAQSTSTLVHKPLELNVIRNHIEGKVSIGAAPLLPGDKVRWCAIDIDDANKFDILTIIRAIEDFDLPLLPCYSKSQKLHIYCFFPEEVDAIDAVDLMRWYLLAFRRPDKTEIFPKQTRMSTNNKFYSWINLPYFDAMNPDNWRKNVVSEGVYRSLDDFVDVAESRQLTLEEHKQRLSELPYFDAPPCVLSGALLRDVGPGIRNQWFYNVACYLRMKDENADIEEALLTLNDTMDSPLPEREIITTVSKVASKTYFYQCTSMLGCNKKQCQKTTLGVGNNTKTTGINFGQLTKILTDPISWKWEINGQNMEFRDTSIFMNQQTFRKLCVEKLNIIPYTVPEQKWTLILRRALENVVEEQVSRQGDFGIGSIFMDAVASFFAGGRRTATNITQVYQDKVYLDELSNKYIFTARSFKAYVADKQEVALSPGDLRIRLVELGAHKREDNLWEISKSDVPVYNKPEVQVDYHDTEVTSDVDVNF